MQNNGHTPTDRIALLDEVRGFCCILMVFHHAFYTAGYSFDVTAGRFLFDFFAVVSPLFAGTFILICGICCHLSHSNWRRGLILCGIAAGMTLVLWLFMPDALILYGILHFLGTAIVLYAALKPLIDRIPPIAGLLVCVLFFVFCWHISPFNGGFFGIPGLFVLEVPTDWQHNDWLFWLGLSYKFSADYFPLLRWIWVFFAGVFLGRYAKEGRFPAWSYTPRAKWLSFVGQHCLLVYVAHQPLLYAVCFVCQLVSRLFVN